MTEDDPLLPIRILIIFLYLMVFQSKGTGGWMDHEAGGASEGPEDDQKS
jgi:hypothetical protein